MPVQAEHPSVSVPRRRACTNCTASKAKCTPFSSSECERCHRLGKECHYAGLSTTRKRPTPSSRLQALERRIEALSARQKDRVSHGQEPNWLSNDDFGATASPVSSQWSNGAITTSTSPGLINSTPSGISSGGFSSLAQHIRLGDIVDRGVLSRELAQALLDRFRDNAAQQFPFVVVSANTSLETIRENSPFLFLAAVASMAFNHPLLQRQLGEELRVQTFQRVTLENEKSLDLLQGLLIYTVWYCHFYRADRHQELLLSQLCVTLAHDLGLDKNKKRQATPFDHRKHVETQSLEHNTEHAPRSEGDEISKRINKNRSFPAASNTESRSSIDSAQMRAYLGTYCISCLVASTLRRRTALAFTKYMDYCCATLATFAEYETDKLIPLFVQSQEISRRIVDTFSYDDLYNGEIRGELLVILTSDAFVRDLERWRQTIPKNLQNNTRTLFHLELLVTRVLIDEAALHSDFWITTSNEHLQTPEAYTLSAARSRMLARSLNSCKEFIQTFLSYKNDDLLYLTAFIYPRLYYVFITLSKIVFFGLDQANGSDQAAPSQIQGQPWNTVDISKQAGFRELGKMTLDKFNAVATDFTGPDGQRDAMSNLASTMRVLIAGYEHQMNESQGALSLETSHSAVQNEQEINTSTVAPIQETDDANGGGAFDVFAWEPSSNTAWDGILADLGLDW